MSHKTKEPTMATQPNRDIDDEQPCKSGSSPISSSLKKASSSSSSGGGGSGNTSSNNIIKCSKCQKIGRKSCSQKACSKCCTDKNCFGHRDVREKEEILNGTHPINILANNKRSLTVQPGAFRDPAFHYLGETIFIWSLEEYMKNSKWREDAIRKSLRNMESRKQALLVKEEEVKRKNQNKRKNVTGDYDKDENEKDTTKVPNKRLKVDDMGRRENRRQRFNRVMNELFEQVNGVE